MPGIRPVAPGDALSVSLGLRQADLAEIAAVTSETPLSALRRSCASGPSWACVDGTGNPFALFGCGGASPWMMGTRGIEENWRWFLRTTPEIVRLMQGDHPLIFNAVDARNTRHVRWIAWAGFTLLDPSPGPQGLPFIPFYRRHPCV